MELLISDILSRLMQKREYQKKSMTQNRSLFAQASADAIMAATEGGREVRWPPREDV